MSSVFSAIKQTLFVTDDQLAEMPEADDECPRCGGTMKESNGLIVTVHYCTNCRFEGAKP